MAIRLGMLTPSSNTVLEPVTAAMLAGLDDASAHFARFRVTEIALSRGALAQFDDRNILEAAALLADAKVDVIGWSGTSASWLGVEADRALCRRITESTGIAATTSVLALYEALEALGARRVGLVTPYTDDVQAKIVANWAGLGLDCVAERHAGIRDNHAFALVDERALREMIGAVAQARPEAIAVVCTNLRAGPLVESLEDSTGICVLDSVATVVWKSLALAGADPGLVKGWGRLFRLPARR